MKKIVWNTKKKSNDVICEYSDKFRFDDEQEKELIVVNGILIQICCMKLKTQGSEIWLGKNNGGRKGVEMEYDAQYVFINQPINWQ